MIIAGEEKKSQGPLIVFIDLLFLLVAFFVLLLFFIQSRQDISDKEMEQVEQSLARITGEEVSLPKALSQLETIVDRFLSEQKQDLEKQRQLARRRQRAGQSRLSGSCAASMKTPCSYTPSCVDKGHSSETRSRGRGPPRIQHHSRRKYPLSRAKLHAR